MLPAIIAGPNRARRKTPPPRGTLPTTPLHPLPHLAPPPPEALQSPASLPPTYAPPHPSNHPSESPPARKAP